MSGVCARERILEAAGEVFAEKGFKAATVREICATAGVNLAGVNYYFGDKQHLYLEVLKLAHPGRPEPLEETLPGEASASERLRMFVKTLMYRLAQESESSWKVRLFRREILDPTPFCRDTFREFFRSRFFLLEGILAEMLPPEMPAWRRRQICFSIVGQCVYFRAAKNVVSMVIGDDEHRAHYNVDDLIDHIMSFSLPALELRNS